MKTSLATLNYNLEIILDLSLDAHAFAKTWSNYLSGAGLTEDQYEELVFNSIFNKGN